MRWNERRGDEEEDLERVSETLDQKKRKGIVRREEKTRTYHPLNIFDNLLFL